MKTIAEIKEEMENKRLCAVCMEGIDFEGEYTLAPYDEGEAFMHEPCFEKYCTDARKFAEEQYARATKGYTKISTESSEPEK